MKKIIILIKIIISISICSTVFCQTIITEPKATLGELIIKVLNPPSEYNLEASINLIGMGFSGSVSQQKIYSLEYYNILQEISQTITGGEHTIDGNPGTWAIEHIEDGHPDGGELWIGYGLYEIRVGEGLFYLDYLDSAYPYGVNPDIYIEYDFNRPVGNRIDVFHTSPSYKRYPNNGDVIKVWEIFGKGSKPVATNFYIQSIVPISANQIEEKLFTNVIVDGNVTIPLDKTFIINRNEYPVPKTLGKIGMHFNSSTSLIVNGTLNAIGTPTNKITFTSQSGTTNSSWGSITFSGSGASGSTIKYANIKYGTEVAAINTSNITIQYCNIDTTYTGIRFNNSMGFVLNNTITTNSVGHGIVAENSSYLTVNDNIITKTYSSRRGVGIDFGGGSGGHVACNNIYGWDWGICAIWGSSPSSYSPVSLQKNNRIRNCNTGLMVYRLSYPWFGLPTAYEHYSLNSISNNNYNARVGTSYPEYESRLFAYNNWWGSNPPNTSLFQIGYSSSFYYNPYLYVDPWAGTAKMAANDGISPTEENIINKASTEDIDLLLYGIELRQQNKYSEAKDYFISYIKNNTDKQAAYVELYNCYSKETADEIISFFNSLPEKASKDHKLLLSYLYLKNGDFKNAKDVNITIAAENPNTELATRAKLNNVYIALYNEDNINEAITIFNEVLNRTELSTPMELSLVHNAIETYANTYGKEITGLAPFTYFESSEEMLNKGDGLNELEIPDQYALLGNYPNPFNPSTTISYALPYQSSVELIIYDLIGSKVKSFNVSSQSTGYQSLVWDGRNENGNPVTSGVYFYKISIKSLENNETFAKTAKLVMLK